MKRQHQYGGRRLQVEPLEYRFLFAADPMLDLDFWDSSVSIVTHPGRDVLSFTFTYMALQSDGKILGVGGLDDADLYNKVE